MRFFRLHIFILTTLFPFLLHAQTSTYSKAEIEEILVMLDSVIAHKNEYQEARKLRADSLEREVNSCSPDMYVEKCKDLYEALWDFDGKRTLKVLERLEKTDRYQEDKNFQAWVALNISRTYGVMGLYHKATNITNSINPDILSKEERLHYYRTCKDNFAKIAEYMSDVSIVQDEEKLMVAYYDSILSLQAPSVARDITLAAKEVYLNRPTTAINAISASFLYAQGEEHSQISMILAFAYNILNENQSYIYYLATTAIDDIMRGSTEYTALPHLVLALYTENHIDRAYNYLMCTMEDADSYPSRSLALDVSKYFPLINTSYSAHQEQQERSDSLKQKSLIFTLIILVITLAIAFYLGWHQNNAAAEKRRADRLQKALDQAAIADRIKTVFIQNMRHEIRTPLNAIMGFAQLMSNDLTDEERDLYNGYIQESNNQLLSTLDSIIDVSNMEVGTFNFHFEHIDLDQLCGETRESLSELMPTGVDYIYQPSRAGMRLYSDRKRVGQVLYNLLSNACKNTISGSITLSATFLPAKDSIQFIVTDTGRGIPADKTDVIFEHFEKLDHYSPGLGLGLYVCRLIARALGGDIILDTTYTTGARFIFTVPNNSVPLPNKEEEKANSNEKKKDSAPSFSNTPV
ncbi:MAG: HAMP domain-containing histidine kinase [Bacteroidaceae bacterium]|nr:HAMP domain-containing histidine kinase [Bacteroidaceae bacterium]